MKLRAREQNAAKSPPLYGPCQDCGEPVRRGKTGRRAKRCKVCHRAEVNRLARERRATDAEYGERYRRQQNERRNHKRRTDPEYRERERERKRAAYLRNPEASRRYNAKVAERLATDPVYRREVWDRKNRWERERNASDPEYRAKRDARRDSRRAAGDLFPGARSLLMEAQRGRCANPLCKARLRDGATHLDHIRPIARGGSNELGNLQLLCQRCNTSKGASVYGDWLARRAG